MGAMPFIHCSSIKAAVQCKAPVKRENPVCRTVENRGKTPDGKEYCTNIKLTASDMELIQKLKQDGGFS